jgi:hypothetical protein
MGDIKVKSWPGLTVNSWPDMLVKVDSRANVLRLKEIAPAAVHIKEVNNIDPLTIESLKIDRVSNLDPIRIEEFNVTRLPLVNLALRQVPSLDMSIRRLPPLSIGVHQNVHIPSHYTVRARLFGVEFLRVNVAGQTMLVPKERAHREQARTHDRSCALPAAVGNPCIPVRRTVETTVCVSPSPQHGHHRQPPADGHAAAASIRHRREPRCAVHVSQPAAPACQPGHMLSFGQPSANVLRVRPHPMNHGGASVSIGGL